MSVADEVSQNLNIPQKEYLIWNWKMSHAGGNWLQTLMKTRRYKNADGSSEERPPVLPIKISSTAVCNIPKCAACLLEKGEKTPTPSRHWKPEK